DPQGLFDVALDDDVATEVEATRLKLLLQHADEEPVVRQDGGALHSAGQERSLWTQRLELDRARLNFYALGPERRAELLRDHRARREAARPAEVEAERRAQQAEAERQRTLEAARAARSEAERAVAEEHARLIAMGAQLDRFTDTLDRER